MLTCKEASQLISQSCDRRLTVGERIGLRVHVFVCKACSRFQRQMKLLHRAARRYAEMDDTVSAGITLSAEARGRILHNLGRAE